MVSGFLCKSIPGADFVARVARALGETEKVPVPFVNHYRGYRLYISHIYYRMHRWPRYFNLCVCVCVFSVLNSEQWHLELFRTGRSHPAWVRSRVDSCVSYTRGRRLYLSLCFFFTCLCVFNFGLSTPLASGLLFRWLFRPGGGGTRVNFCWVCAAGLLEPLPHYSLFCGQI